MNPNSLTCAINSNLGFNMISIMPECLLKRKTNMKTKDCSLKSFSMQFKQMWTNNYYSHPECVLFDSLENGSMSVGNTNIMETCVLSSCNTSTNDIKQISALYHLTNTSCFYDSDSNDILSETSTNSSSTSRSLASSIDDLTTFDITSNPMSLYNHIFITDKMESVKTCYVPNIQVLADPFNFSEMKLSDDKYRNLYYTSLFKSYLTKDIHCFLYENITNMSMTTYKIASLLNANKPQGPYKSLFFNSIFNSITALQSFYKIFKQHIKQTKEYIKSICSLVNTHSNKFYTMFKQHVKQTNEYIHSIPSIVTTQTNKLYTDIKQYISSFKLFQYINQLNIVDLLIQLSNSEFIFDINYNDIIHNIYISTSSNILNNINSIQQSSIYKYINSFFNNKKDIIISNNSENQTVKTTSNTSITPVQWILHKKSILEAKKNENMSIPALAKYCSNLILSSPVHKVKCRCLPDIFEDKTKPKKNYNDIELFKDLCYCVDSIDQLVYKEK